MSKEDDLNEETATEGIIIGKILIIIAAVSIIIGFIIPNTIFVSILGVILLILGIKMYQINKGFLKDNEEEKEN